MRMIEGLLEIHKKERECHSSKIFMAMYWVVRKVRADVEGKFKRRKFKF